MIFVCYHLNFKCHIFGVHRLVKLYKPSVVREILRTTRLGDRDIRPLLPHTTAMELITHTLHTTLLKVVQISQKSHFLLPMGTKHNSWGSACFLLLWYWKQKRFMSLCY